VAVAALVTIALVLAGGAYALTRAQDKESGGTSGSGTAAGPGPLPASALPPTSAPLSTEQIAVPMKVDGNWDVYLADVRTAAPVKRLTTDPASEFSPAISPDRRSIIFVHEVGLTRTLRIMAADGTGQRSLFAKIPPECVTNFRPGWNPRDPTMLALACIDARGTSGLYLVRIDGTVLRTLPIAQPKVDDPSFSPDGRTVVYYAGPTTSFDGGSLFTIPVDGGAPRRLTDVAPGTDADPAWSPDGTRIAFRRRLPNGTTGGNFDVFVMPADGSAPPRPITTAAADDQDPSWSPFGGQIALKSGRATSDGKGEVPSQVWIMNADGTKPRLLWTRSADGEESAPAWSRR
jgi:Tol biopolymer transport system component